VKCCGARWPKKRIREKVMKPEYRARYEEHCRKRGEKAIFNLHGRFVWVVRSETG
jgi:membrane protein DedA with SNARE-associated domain